MKVQYTALAYGPDADSRHDDGGLVTHPVGLSPSDTVSFVRNRLRRCESAPTTARALIVGEIVENWTSGSRRGIETYTPTLCHLYRYCIIYHRLRNDYLYSGFPFRSNATEGVTPSTWYLQVLRYSRHIMCWPDSVERAVHWNMCVTWDSSHTIEQTIFLCETSSLIMKHSLKAQRLVRSVSSQNVASVNMQIEKWRRFIIIIISLFWLSTKTQIQKCFRNFCSHLCVLFSMPDSVDLIVTLLARNLQWVQPARGWRRM